MFNIKKAKKYVTPGRIKEYQKNYTENWERLIKYNPVYMYFQEWFKQRGAFSIGRHLTDVKNSLSMSWIFLQHPRDKSQTKAIRLDPNGEAYSYIEFDKEDMLDIVNNYLKQWKPYFYNSNRLYPASDSWYTVIYNIGADSYKKVKIIFIPYISQNILDANQELPVMTVLTQINEPPYYNIPHITVYTPSTNMMNQDYGFIRYKKDIKELDFDTFEYILKKTAKKIGMSWDDYKQYLEDKYKDILSPTSRRPHDLDSIYNLYHKFINYIID